MSGDDRRRAPGRKPAAEKVTPATNTAHGTDTHPAITAADAGVGIFMFLWEQAIRQCAREGQPFSADTVQERFSLPPLGNRGGIFMRLHREGVIRRIGYRPSSRPSRQGSVIAAWIGAE